MEVSSSSTRFTSAEEEDAAPWRVSSKSRSRSGELMALPALSCTLILSVLANPASNSLPESSTKIECGMSDFAEATNGAAAATPWVELAKTVTW